MKKALLLIGLLGGCGYILEASQAGVYQGGMGSGNMDFMEGVSTLKTEKPITNMISIMLKNPDGNKQSTFFQMNDLTARSLVPNALNQLDQNNVFTLTSSYEPQIIQKYALLLSQGNTRDLIDFSNNIPNKDEFNKTVCQPLGMPFIPNFPGVATKQDKTLQEIKRNSGLQETESCLLLYTGSKWQTSTATAISKEVMQNIAPQQKTNVRVEVNAPEIMLPLIGATLNALALKNPMERDTAISNICNNFVPLAGKNNFLRALVDITGQSKEYFSPYFEKNTAMRLGKIAWSSSQKFLAVGGIFAALALLSYMGFKSLRS